MKRLFEDHAYSAVPRAGCYWSSTAQRMKGAQLGGDLSCDIAVIGGGYTGLNAARELAEAGHDVAVFDANFPGWGASGRNGGFCCLGGAKLGPKAIVRRYGQEAAQAWGATERAAVEYVDAFITDADLQVERQSHGETQLAHSRRAWDDLQNEARADKSLHLIPPEALQEHGLNGPFYGALTTPVGFALNPAKYAQGVLRAALAEGAAVFENTPVLRIGRDGSDHVLHTPQGRITARKVIVATNGYSAEDIPQRLRSAFMPVQSSIIVTRPLTEAEIAEAGWHSDQMAYDTRNLLHYFRLLPNRRFLFGMRGGVFATRRVEQKIDRLIHRNFRQMFPAWAHVETPYRWSGLICMTARRLPFNGPLESASGLFASLGYHGNGVAMASYMGHCIARQVMGQPSPAPAASLLALPLKKFPFGMKRRWIMPPAFAAMKVLDR